MKLLDWQTSLFTALRVSIPDSQIQANAVCLQPHEWCKLLELSQQQKLLPLVIDALGGCAALEDWAGSAAAKRAARLQVAAQALRTQDFLRVYNQLCAAGVTPLVVKGIVCRMTYPKGDLRPSADEDIFVGDAQFETCCEILRQAGMQCEENANTATDDVISWRAADGNLCIELHRSLFPTQSSVFASLEGFFSGALAKPYAYEVPEGGVVYSLNPHEHLLYLLLHAWKHFIYSGFGLRQVCDIALWAQRYAEQIDWALLTRQTACVRADVFTAAVFQIATEHLGFSLPDAPKLQELSSEAMLSDLLCAGVYGTADRSRQHAASLTFRAVETQKSGRLRGLLAAAFPARKNLCRAYPELVEKPYLLPLVWCRRLAKYRTEVRQQADSSASETIQIAESRTAMLRYYKIL